MNEGLARSRGDWLLLLNNDATLEPSAAGALLEAGRSAPDVGSVACQMRFTGTEASTRPASAWTGSASPSTDCSASRRRQPNETAEVFGASGGAALYRRAMLEDIGGFDDSFFAYLEDADVAWRAQMRGWRCLYQPRAVAHHRYSATSGHRSSFKYFHSGRNRVRLLAKNAARQQLLRHGPHILAYDLAYVAVSPRATARSRRSPAASGAARVAPVPFARGASSPGGARARPWRARRPAAARELGPLCAVAPRWRAPPGDRPGRPKPRMTATLTPPTVDLPAGLRTLAVLHLAEVSGPSRTLRPRLERLAGHGDVEVVVPGPGGAAESYRDIARITALDYRPLSFPAPPAISPRSRVASRGRRAPSAATCARRSRTWW